MWAWAEKGSFKGVLTSTPVCCKWVSGFIGIVWGTNSMGWKFRIHLEGHLREDKKGLLMIQCWKQGIEYSTTSLGTIFSFIYLFLQHGLHINQWSYSYFYITPDTIASFKNVHNRTDLKDSDCMLASLINWHFAPKPVQP